MEFDPGPELVALRSRARRFTEEELIPLERDVEERGPLPEDVSRRLRLRAIEERLWPMNVPREMGGLSSFVCEQVIAQEEAVRATNDLWGYVGGGPYNALKAGTPQQRRKYLQPALRGDLAVEAAYAVTEPTGGSDTSSLKTTAVKKADRWVINGEKWFVTSHGRAPVTIVHATSGPRMRPWREPRAQPRRACAWRPTAPVASRS